MDLDISNYSTSDLLKIFKITNKNLSQNKMQQVLINKIEKIKNSDRDLGADKDDLIYFFIKGYFKLISDRNLEIEMDNFVIPNLQKSMGNNITENIGAYDQHKNKPSETESGEGLQPGYINPLSLKTYKKILNINSRFRDNYQTSVSTDFHLDLPYTIKKVISIKLIGCELPNKLFTISSALGSNYFRVRKTGVLHYDTVIIPDGNYSAPEIITQINNNSVMIDHDLQASYNLIDGRITIKNTVDPLSTFDLKFNSDDTKTKNASLNTDSLQTTLGWILGFRGNFIKKPNAVKQDCKYVIKNNVNEINEYIGLSEYISECSFDSYGTRYFLLSVNDFNNNYNEMFISPFKNQTLSDQNIIAKISIDEYNTKFSETTIARKYFGPVNISKLDIKLFDEFGRIIDFNHSDFSFTLEVELLYDL